MLVIKDDEGFVCELTQEQCDALVPVLNQRMTGELSARKFDAAVKSAFTAAGVPLQPCQRRPGDPGPSVKC